MWPVGEARQVVLDHYIPTVLRGAESVVFAGKRILGAGTRIWRERWLVLPGAAPVFGGPGNGPGAELESGDAQSDRNHYQL